ncbi:MAG: hypothetical protein BroJett029_34090 [Alphaproteobacteria bacterium]|nr:MAG: hypothetical protein BroJett029_34090 [Alphaproteobacteria bacterium]
MRRAPPLVALLLAALFGAASLAAPVPEPEGFWTGPMGGAVPATIAGGTVIDTAGLQALVAKGGVVLVDVAPAPRRPEGMDEGTLWLPPPHRSLPGSVWLADVGQGELDPARDAWYRLRLAELTHGDRAKPVVVYCHPNCWASWNAAKRAILYGYSRVYWYPDGVEGWQDAGLPTVVREAEQPAD